MTDPSRPQPTASAASGEEEALRLAKDLVQQNAPWKAGASWQVVLTQGTVLGVVGALLWLAPGVASYAMLLLAVVLLASATVSVWRLLRGQVAPRRVGIIAFRAGVGVTTGLLAIIGSLLVGETDSNKVVLAVVLGTGFLLYGLASAVAALVGRQQGAGFPVLAVLISLTAAVVGLVLILQGNAGVDALRSTFSTLGIVLLVAGLAIAGYAFYLRSNAVTDPTD